MADEITKLLDAYHANTLWEIARVGGLVVTDHMGKRLGKKEVMRKMQAEFFTPMRVSASLARLNERERAVLNRLLLRGGTASTKSLRREVLRAGLVTAVEESRPRGHYHRRRPLRRGIRRQSKQSSLDRICGCDRPPDLSRPGVQQGRAANQWGHPLQTPVPPRRHPLRPRGIRRILPEPEPIPVKVPDWQPDQIRTGDPALLLRDLYLYWDFVRCNEVPLLQSGLVGKRSLKAINDILLVPDPSLQEARRENETERLYLLRVLLEKLDLVHRYRGQLRLTNEDALHIPPFWAWPEPRQIKTCLDAWASLGATTGQEEDALGNTIPVSPTPAGRCWHPSRRCHPMPGLS